jgi:hypothetical protein
MLGCVASAAYRPCELCGTSANFCGAGRTGDGAMTDCFTDEWRPRVDDPARAGEGGISNPARPFSQRRFLPFAVMERT